MAESDFIKFNYMNSLFIINVWYKHSQDSFLVDGDNIEESILKVKKMVDPYRDYIIDVIEVKFENGIYELPSFEF